MLALMILYTVSSLWILSQPIVEDERAEAAVGVAGALREAPLHGPSLRQPLQSSFFRYSQSLMFKK